MIVNNTNELVSLLKCIVKDKLTNFSNLPVNINFDTSLKYGNGYLSTFDDVKSLHDITGITIGVKSLNMEVLDFEQIIVFVKTVFHELRHAEQEYMHKTEDSPMMYSMGLTYIACLLYDDYYRDRYNYFHNIKEIDAEYHGLKNAYDFLSNVFDEKVATESILHFINWHVTLYKNNNDKIYYIDVSKAYDNVSDVWVAFETSIKNSMIVRRNCDFWKNDNYFHCVYDESNGLIQDEMIVKYYFEMYPGNARHIRNNTIALKNL